MATELKDVKTDFYIQLSKVRKEMKYTENESEVDLSDVDSEVDKLEAIFDSYIELLNEKLNSLFNEV